MQKGENLKISEKLQLSCSVAMMALLLRFLVETDNCKDFDISEVTRFFAAHFQTTRQPNISALSLRGKYDKPQTVHVKLFQQWMKDGLILSQMWGKAVTWEFRHNGIYKVKLVVVFVL